MLIGTALIIIIPEGVEALYSEGMCVYTMQSLEGRGKRRGVRRREKNEETADI